MCITNYTATIRAQSSTLGSKEESNPISLGVSILRVVLVPYKGAIILKFVLVAIDSLLVIDSSGD